MQSKRTIQWAAGLFEGEGTIIIRKPRKSQREISTFIDLQLASVDKDVLQAFLKIVGGKVYGPYGPYQPNQSKYWKWYVYGQEAKRVLKKLHKYFLSRRFAKAKEALRIPKRLGRLT